METINSLQANANLDDMRKANELIKNYVRVENEKVTHRNRPSEWGAKRVFFRW